MNAIEYAPIKEYQSYQNLDDHIIVDKNYFIVVEDNDQDIFIIDAILKDINPDYKIDYFKNVMDIKVYLKHLIKVRASYPIKLPTLIFIDLSLPDSDGSEILKLLSNHELLEDIPAVILTGNKSFDKALECLKYGARSYITKPNTLKGWESELQSMIKKYSI